MISEGIDCDGNFDLWNISEGCKKIGFFCGGRQGYCVSTFDLFFLFF